MSELRGPKAGEPQEWTVLKMLEWATGYFAQKQVSNPRLSIEWLLGEVLGLKRLDLYLKHDRPLSPTELGRLRPWVARRARHEPLQYIVGYAEFYGCRFEVGPAVLVPRPETEQLVELVLDSHGDDPHSVVDFGTGSGCIAVALKRARPSWRVVGVDLSADALELAGKNATANGVQIEWKLGDMRNPLQAAGSRDFDIVVSNPPYILPAEKADMEREVCEYEPHLALFDDDPAELYAVLADFAESCGKAARFYGEIHSGQGEVVLERVRREGREATVTRDYAGRDRMLSIRFDVEAL